jgi:4-alpha-glucanotransferase
MAGRGGNVGFSRCAGIVLHPTSLPGPGGIGGLGADARRFVDFLAACGVSLWQILPLGPTGYGNSPYSGHSAFAGNPLLIDLEPLRDEGWLSEFDLRNLPAGDGQSVDFGSTTAAKMGLLRRAFDRFSRVPGRDERIDTFVTESTSWLPEFALFMSLKEAHGGASWEHWEPELRCRDATAVAKAKRTLRDDIDFHRFVQAIFDRQWSDLKHYANSSGVAIVGDLPIFVAYDSADVWSHQDQFRLDSRALPEVVAGVPPDYFSRTGQLWGNPHYRWDVMERDGFGWWIDRFASLTRRVDVVRLDHFRGFAAAWSVPYGNETAELGEWSPSPGRRLFEAVHRRLGDLPIIAEDLGVITRDVIELREQFGFPGMHILQFAFGSDAHNESLPHNHRQNTCVYTGTHDNDTTAGWYRSLRVGEQARVETYLGAQADDISWQLMRLAFASVADLAVVPLQDVLRLGPEARMNLPGTVENNWRWRFRWEDLQDDHVCGLRRLLTTYGRVGFQDFMVSGD